MNIWIVTTGSSDIQLKTDKNWNHLFKNVRNKFNNLRFSPSQPPNADVDEPFTVPARVMGVVYGEQLDDNLYNDLKFPLLDTFSPQLQGTNLPNKIIVILTNQEAAFSEQKRRIRKCPYWQDTCTLKPILANYFQFNFSQVKEIEYLELKPQSEDDGLDNWNKALPLVQQALSNLVFEKTTTIYVSHQAGTPAISSAIQFVSLARFGKQVKFLVSNEDKPDKPAEEIESSAYLHGIQLQEAKVLLDRYDYLGVKELLSAYWKNLLDLQEQRIHNLLAMAIHWNCAKFEEFAEARGEIAQERSNQWWWTGYEAAYLAVVRLEQGNTVEALFHSFRAAEGIICEWAQMQYKHHIEYKKDGSPLIRDSILKELPDFYPKKLSKDPNKPTKDRKISLYSESLYQLLQKSRPEWHKDDHIKVVWGSAREKRNPLFHRLLGLQEIEVFQAWDSDNRGDWEARILGCLNYVSGQKFASLKEGSLMSSVHEELREAIANYELKA